MPGIHRTGLELAIQLWINCLPQCGGWPSQLRRVHGTYREASCDGADGEGIGGKDVSCDGADGEGIAGRDMGGHKLKAGMQSENRGGWSQMCGGSEGTKCLEGDCHGGEGAGREIMGLLD